MLWQDLLHTPLPTAVGVRSTVGLGAGNSVGLQILRTELHRKRLVSLELRKSRGCWLEGTSPRLAFCSKQGCCQHQISSARALASSVLNNTKDRDCTTSPGNLSQCSTTFAVTWLLLTSCLSPSSLSVAIYPLTYSLPLPIRLWLCHLHNCSSNRYTLLYTILNLQLLH